MKRSILLAIGLSLLQTSEAQDWCTSSATWRSWTSGFGWEIHRETTCGGDTSINGLQAYRMESRRVGSVVSVPVDNSYHDYIAVAEDIIWYAKSTSPFDLDTLAILNAQPGDAWTYEVPGVPSFNVRVTATGTGLRNFGAVQLRYVTVDYTAMFGPVNDTIFERIGPLLIDPFAPTTAFGMESDYSGLVCYHDDDLSWVAGYEPIGCFTPLSVKGYELVGPERIPALFPNPSDGMVYSTSTAAGVLKAHVTLHDAQGRIVAHFMGSELARGVDLSRLAPGCYLFILVSEQGLRISATWLKS